MSNDDIARLLAEVETLHAQADALSTHMSAHHDPRIRYTGEDRNGLVRMIVDGHGRATDVVVARNWRQETDPGGLAHALVTAMGQAQARRLEAWAAGGAPATTTLLDRTPPTGEPLAGADGPDLIRDLMPILDEAERRLDEAERQLAQHFTHQARLTSPGGELTITVRAGQVAEIEFDDHWIASANNDQVAQRVCQLLQNAHDRAWTRIGDLIPRELGALMSFAADPAQMLRRLGLQP